MDQAAVVCNIVEELRTRFVQESDRFLLIFPILGGLERVSSNE